MNAEIPTRPGPSLSRRSSRIVIIGVALVFLGVLLWLHLRLYAAPRGVATRGRIATDARLQLANIGRRPREGEGTRMQEIFPEGWFFSHARYGMAWANAGLQTGDTDLKRRAAEEVRRVLQRMDLPEAVAPFRANTQMPNGVCYLGWAAVPETRFPGTTSGCWRCRLHGISVLTAGLVVFLLRGGWQQPRRTVERTPAASSF